MMKTILATLVLFSLGAQADVAVDFKALDKERKGPFTENYLQNTRGRSSLGSGRADGCISNGGGGGRAQFQAAFRNALGQKLAAQDFYVGNLFTTNYYQLTGEYVYGKPCGSHDDDPVGLWSASEQAMPKASSMVRHWVLEKHYVEHLPDSALAKAFKLRGISDSANEAQYASLFFDFYLNSMTLETQFLPAYLLIKESPVGQSASIDKARQIVAESYEYFARNQCGSIESRCTPIVKRLYQLRNAVHNQLSEDVIKQVDQFLADFPEYERGGNTYLQKVQDILRAYYSFSSKKIAEQAQKAGLSAIVEAANTITREGASVANLLVLSNLGADLRSNITSMSEKRTEALLTIAAISQFVNKEINNMDTITSKDVVQSILNAIYMEGFLIKDNWQYFTSEVQAAPDLNSAAAQLADYAEIAQATLDMAFDPALAQWIAVEPKMQYFVDNTIKSSSLNTASIVAGKLQK